MQVINMAACIFSPGSSDSLSLSITACRIVDIVPHKEQLHIWRSQRSRTPTTFYMGLFYFIGYVVWNVAAPAYKLDNDIDGGTQFISGRIVIIQVSRIARLAVGTSDQLW